MKKILSIVLVLTFVLTPFSSFTAVATEEMKESVYVVAGNKAEVFGLIWYKYPTDTNTMKKDDEIYTLTIKDVEPQAELDFQVVENTPDGKQKIYGYRSSSMYDEPSVEFRVIEKCDVTFTFNPTTKYVDVIGDGVKRVSGVERVYAFDYHKKLTNGVYDRYHDKGEMTLGEDGVYSVTYKAVEPAESIIIDVSDQTLGELLMGFYGFNFCAIDVTKTCDVTV